MGSSITDPEISNRVCGLNRCFEELEGKLTSLKELKERLKGDEAKTVVIFKLKRDLEDVKQRMNQMLMQYDQDAVDHDGNVMNQLEEFIIEVDKIKRSFDLALRNFQMGVDELEKKDGDAIERFRRVLELSASSDDDGGQEVSDSEVFPGYNEALKRETKALMRKGK